MSPSSKSGATQVELGKANTYRIAIVGAASLMGKEIAEVLRDRNFPAVDIRLLDDDESLGQLEAVGDEMSFIQSITADQFERVDFTFFAADPRATRAKWKTAQDHGNTIIDLSAALEDDPRAAVRAPWIERQAGQSVPPQLQPGPAVVAHPVAIVLALLALRLQKAARLERMLATVFHPASEYGQRGMDELHEQTVKLLSFQDLPKNVFDAQVAFNMIARYGNRSEHSLDAISTRIRKHYRLIAPHAIEPSLFAVQAPIFHGHAFSIYFETEKPLSPKEISQSLTGEHVAMPGADESPNNVSAAGQNDVLVSLSPDPVHNNGFWLWVAIDNLRVAALNAVECAETLTTSRPKGQIQ